MKNYLRGPSVRQRSGNTGLEDSVRVEDLFYYTELNYVARYGSVTMYVLSCGRNC